MPKLFICSECNEEYNPLITEDDCGLCSWCSENLYHGQDEEYAEPYRDIGWLGGFDVKPTK